ncbi:hypothetical protein ACFOWA_19620 [Pedobacter lithocola]|uniref:MazG C-terminal domain-containing protein n=1 Tax=Pedobacter lithocola TaxID=1908239 RepID=A0ABV8PGC7_9SPHI
MEQRKQNKYFDENYSPSEQIPRAFSVAFEEVKTGKKGEVRVTINETNQLGDIINDNSSVSDYYRYHDIFHYSFATILGWSPCTRAMMKRKRKSDPVTDENEDGARATITEEALSMIIFNEAKRKNYFLDSAKVSKTTLRIIKEMTENFEVKVRTSQDWEKAILTAYRIFRHLISNNGGVVHFDLSMQKVIYQIQAN